MRRAPLPVRYAYPRRSRVAQSAERPAVNRQVIGSSPIAGVPASPEPSVVRGFWFPGTGIIDRNPVHLFPAVTAFTPSGRQRSDHKEVGVKPRTVIPRRTALRAAAIAVGVAVAAGVPTAVSAAAATAPASTSYTGTLANGTTWIADVPAQWNGTLLLYSHGFGPLTAADAPDPGDPGRAARPRVRAGRLLLRPQRLGVGTGHRRQRPVRHARGGRVHRAAARPAHVLAFGTSMGGLVSALEAQQGAGKIDGALTTCGIVGGGVNLNEYQIDGEYAIAQLLGNPSTQLVGFGDDDDRARHRHGADRRRHRGADDRRRAGTAGPGARLPEHDRRGCPRAPRPSRLATRRRRRPPSTT